MGMRHLNEVTTCIMSLVEVEISLKIILTSDRLQIKELLEVIQSCAKKKEWLRIIYFCRMLPISVFHHAGYAGILETGMCE